MTLHTISRWVLSSLLVATLGIGIVGCGGTPPPPPPPNGTCEGGAGDHCPG